MKVASVEKQSFLERAKLAEIRLETVPYRKLTIFSIKCEFHSKPRSKQWICHCSV